MSEQKKIESLEDIFNNLMERYNTVNGQMNDPHRRYTPADHDADILRLSKVGARMAEIQKEIREQKKAEGLTGRRP